MKIAFISQGHGRIDPPTVNGSISIWTYEVMNVLKRTENIIAYEMDGEGTRSRTREYDGIRYIYAPSTPTGLINRVHGAASNRLGTIKPLGRRMKGPLFSSIFHNLGYIFWVAAHLKRQRCDVIHIHQFSQYVPIVRMLNPASKIVLHMNCEWLTQLDRELIRGRMEKADLVLGCSDYISGLITQKFPEFRQKVRTVYNGVHHERFKPTGDGNIRKDWDPCRLLFVGRVSPEKGIHVLIDALEHLVRRYPSIHLNIVGGIGSAPREYIVDLSDDPRVRGLSKFYPEHGEDGGHYYGILKGMVKNRLESRVTFTGGVPYAQVLDFYRQADILVNPSFSESFGMSLAEAMASEKPVVATRVGGMVNVAKDGETGLLVEAGDVDGLADAIVSLIDNPELRKTMGKAGRKRILERFSWERVAESLRREYESLA